MADADPIAVDADYVCPFWDLGRESLVRYRGDREDPLAVEWHPFDLRSNRRTPAGDIDPDAETGKDGAYYAEARQNVRRLADECGVDMATELAGDIDSYAAQLASVHVQMTHPEDWLAFDRGLYDPLWQAERNIEEPDVVASVAAGVGLDPDGILDALDDHAVERRLEDQFEAARLRGISGVRTFVYENHSVRGAVPPEHLKRLVEGADKP